MNGGGLLGSLIAGLAGLFFGSFLGVVIYRVPRKQSIVRPRSACTACGHTLGAADLIPVVSYITSRGRCRHCDAPVSARYVIIEFVTGGAFGFVYALSADWQTMVAGIALYCLLIVMFFIDMEHMVLPNAINGVGAAAGLSLSVLGWTGLDLYESLMGIVVGFGIVLLIHLLSRGGMGMGDAKFLAAIGSFLGAGNVLFVLFVASFIGAAIGGGLIATGQRHRKQPIPFGPFLAVGAAVAWVWPVSDVIGRLQHLLF